VPQQVFMSGAADGKGAASLGMVSTLVDLMVAEKSGFRTQCNGEVTPATETATAEVQLTPIR
jgi:hypothetical protein